MKRNGMQTTKRFVREYINYKRKTINDNSLMRQEFKKEKLDKISRVEAYLKHGTITIDEGMKTLAEI